MRADTTAPALVVAAVLLAYFNAVGAAFQFDDYNVIVDNPAVHSLGAWADSMPGIRPLLKLSYALNWKVSGSPFGFHLVNVVLHAVNALLVLRLLRALAPAMPWAGLAGALLFALHPAQTEAVTYVSGRSVSLMALFYLAAAAAWMRANREREDRPWRLASAALFGVALLVKETAVTLPAALLLLDARDAHAPATARARLLNLRWHAAVLAVALAVMTASPTYRHLLGVSLGARGIADNLLTQANALVWLAGQLVAPWHLNADPDLPVVTSMSLALLPALAVVAALAAFVLRHPPRHSWLAFALLWCFLHLLPTNSLLPRLDVANDRQLYLAAIGFFFVAGLALEALARRGRMKRFVTGATVALLVGLGTVTVQRNQVYASAIAFWEDTLEKSPRKARVANNLGYAYQQAGRIEEAKLAYRQAIEADPDYWRARINLEALDHAGTR
ncbi:MAG TPA: tetratricopeptide repeat protein [Burkholderiales bacterium]|nr:tetratricopeptide repeat protein [Burkholderiales bacterium]